MSVNDPTVYILFERPPEAPSPVTAGVWLI